MRESEDNPKQSITSLIEPVTLSKESARAASEKIADMIFNGDANPLNLSSRIAWMISVLENAKELIRDEAVRELEKHGGTVTMNNAEITKVEAGVKYKYDSCGDYEWEANDSLIHSATEARKKREAFLRSLQKPMTHVNEDTGEIETINPPVRTSTTTVKITFK